MEDNAHHIKTYNFIRTGIFALVLLDIYIQCISFHFNDNPFIERLNRALYQFPLLVNVQYSHVLIFISVMIVAGIGAQAVKDLDFNFKKQFAYLFTTGLLLFLISIPSIGIDDFNVRLGLYSITYFSGAILLFMAFSNLSKYIWTTLKKDIWNAEQESFMQNQQLITDNYLCNLPIQFYYRRKVHKGWINMNVFRAILVMGVPGSGKSASVIIPYMKQMLAKGFSMLVYDFKFPDLGKIAYYHYLLNYINNGSLSKHAFHVVNLDNVEYSARINPVDAAYIQNLADASETADAIVSALTKSDKSSGSAQFFDTSAKNFLAACIYFLATYEKGKFSTLPHVMAFIAQPYDFIFKALFSNPELRMLLAPFKSAYDNKAFEQLEGQIGTVRINISRIGTKESFWVFSGSDFDLKISNPQNPSVMILANSPDTQSINSAFFAAILMRVTKLVNSKGNVPCSIVVDEAPTVFLHKIENLIATARSNKVSVILGIQEIAQLILQYGKDNANTITSIMGTILTGSVKSKESLDWMEKMLGRIKQVSTGVSIDRNKTNVSLNEKNDNVIPASRIANLNAGEIVGLVAKENSEDYGKFQPNIFNCKINLDFKQLTTEEALYKDLPQVYHFGTNEEKHKILMANFEKINKEIASIKV
jgi:type IV secretory pathway TraG/TraD family ATPase VirD4